MENIILSLPSGYIVTFKPYLNYGQKRQISKMLSSKMSVDATTQKTNTTIDGETMMEAQDLALKQMLVSVQKPDTTVLTGDAAYEEVQSMKDADGEAVYTKLDEITTTTPLDEDKKKLQSSSSSAQAKA